MIPQAFNQNLLSPATLEVLNDLDGQVNGIELFAEKVDRAKSLWRNKKDNEAKWFAFEEIGATLKLGSECEGVCTYCEHNETADIEHVKPKGFFPEYCFDWGNYVAACKNCNSGYKLDKCSIIDDVPNLIELTKGQQPSTQETAFINPRIENPADFMFLDLLEFRFKAYQEQIIGRRNFLKAKNTLAILKLNERDKLVLARSNAFNYFAETLLRCARIFESDTKEDIRLSLLPNEQRTDFSRDIDEIKYDLLRSQSLHIQKRHHPTVWLEMKRQRKMYPDLDLLFKRIPQALDW